MTGVDGPQGPGHLVVLVLVLALLAGCTSSGPLEAPEADLHRADLGAEPTPEGEPTGTVRIAHPGPPSAFLQPTGRDVAADDLAALWGLPLFRLDPAGQLRRGLVESWRVEGATAAGWTVRLGLRSGSWTDGTAVDSSDVVASLRRRMEQEPARFAPITDVVADGEHAVRVTFDRPHASWADLLVEAGSVLPSTVVRGGPDGYRDAVPISGGPFRLESVEPALRARFVAHASGPLGPPRLAAVEVLFTPQFETALGLLEDGEVDVLLGHLPVNGVGRSEEVDGVAAAAPLGGTTVSLAFREDGAYGGPGQAVVRRGVADTVDVREFVEGLLGPHGEVAGTPWPGAERPAGVPEGALRGAESLTLAFPRDVGVLGFTARTVQRDLASRGLAAELVSVPRARLGEPAATAHDAALEVRRTSRRPSLAPWVDADVARVAGASDVAARGARDGLSAVAERARIVPLYRVGVLHAWRGVDGVRPSSWVGAGLWNVREWRLAD